MREVMLVLHILGAALWIGGGIVTVAARRAMVRRGSTPAVGWMDFEATLGKVFFPVAAVLTLLSGIVLVLMAHQYGFLDLFVIIGIAAFLFSAIGNSAYVGRTDARAVASWREGDEPTARSLVANTTRFHLLDNAVLVLALVAMVYRWGS